MMDGLAPVWCPLSRYLTYSAAQRHSHHNNTITIVTNHNRYRHYPSLDIHPFQDGNSNGSTGNAITLVFIITSIGILGIIIIDIIGER